jgi:hypothetical protein
VRVLGFPDAVAVDPRRRWRQIHHPRESAGQPWGCLLALAMASHLPQAAVSSDGPTESPSSLRGGGVVVNRRAQETFEIESFPITSLVAPNMRSSISVCHSPAGKRRHARSVGRVRRHRRARCRSGVGPPPSRGRRRLPRKPPVMSTPLLWPEGPRALEPWYWESSLRR